jgi:uncharacterized protein YaiL (DUF2058 family)
MDDLRSQLLKAGLVSEKQVKEAESVRRKQRKVKRAKAAAAAPDPEVLRRKQELEEAKRLDRERQRQAHLARERNRQDRADAERQAREAAEQARRIISQSGVALSDDAEHEYRFLEEGRTVRTVLVTEQQRKALSRGEMGLARPHAHLNQWYVLERKAALRLRDVCPEKLLLLHEPADDEDEFDGLMW